MLLVGDRFFRLTDDGGEGFGLLDGHVCKNFAVEFDLGEVQAVNELRIFDVVQTASRVDADDPQFTKVTLLKLSAGIGEIQCPLDRFFRRAIKF